MHHVKAFIIFSFNSFFNSEGHLHRVFHQEKMQDRAENYTNCMHGSTKTGVSGVIFGKASDQCIL